VNVGSKKSSSDTTVTQNNNANVVNDVTANAKTGDNDAKYNTGGDVVINTGDAKTKVSVTTLANANFATVGGGSAGAGNGNSVSILGNGANSDNSVHLNDNKSVNVSQNNDANVSNDVDANAKTGNNDANFNTGGETTINTGNAKTEVGVDNLVNFNSADVDCGCVLGGVDLKIAHNGDNSDNSVTANNDNGQWVGAENLASLGNNVDGNAKTGDNNSKYNTAGGSDDPTVNTGDSNSSTDVSNSGNVNTFGNGASLDLPGGNTDLSFNFDLHGILSFFHLAV
jgi:hypothetical protein